MKQVILNVFILGFILNSYSQQTEIFTDARDDKVYKIVKIGNQVWMAENLNTSHYLNGDSIPQVQDKAEWVALTTGAWCYYQNDAENGKTYGKLYNWYAVNDPRGLAPEGWHIPTDAEWIALIDYLGGTNVAGGKMKQIGTVHWISPNLGATNESGFSALPGGLWVERWFLQRFG